MHTSRSSVRLRQRPSVKIVLLLLCPQRCTQWRTLSETESRPGFRVEWKVTGSAALGVRLLFGLRQGTGGGEAKAGHPLRGTRRNLVCLLCLFYFQASCYIVSTKSDGLEAALGGARASNREALVLVNTEPILSRAWMGQRTCAGREDFSAPGPKQSKAKSRPEGRMDEP